MFDEVRKFWNRLDYMNFYEGAAIPILATVLWILADAAVSVGAPKILHGFAIGLTFPFANYLSLRAEERAFSEQEATDNEEVDRSTSQPSMPEPTKEDFDRLIHNINPQKLNDFFERRAGRTEPSSAPQHIDVEGELRRIKNAMSRAAQNMAHAEANGEYQSAAAFQAQMLVLESESRQLASQRSSYDHSKIADLRHEYSRALQNLAHTEQHGNSADIGYSKGRVKQIEAELRILGA